MDNNTHLLSNLNEEQKQAVCYTEGPELIIAGAGAGKTRVITHKIAYLIEQGISPHSILALTFTNKAAKEMTERTIQLLNGSSLHDLWIGTFHSIAAKILRIEIEHTRYKQGFSIYDTTDSKNIARQICKDNNFNEKLYTPALVLHKISTAKNHLVLPGQYAQNTTFAKQDAHDQLYEMAKFYALYQNTLYANNAMDFDDILLNLYLLLSNYPAVKQKYDQLFHYILVDEYQDTNYIQNILIRELSQVHQKLCVVGDDAQSIYAFRGADIYNILNFMTVYPNAKLFKLQQNYRSTQLIVTVANGLIQHNTHQIQKKIFSQNAIGEKIQLSSFYSDKDEGDGIAQIIVKLLKNKNAPHNNIAVLYRTNAQSRIFENVLRQYNIPYNIYGTTGFFQRKEIKDVLAYLRLFVNPTDDEALLRIINFPKRGIGSTTIQKLKLTAIQNSIDLYTLITHIDLYCPDFSKSTQVKILQFATLLEKTKEEISTLNAYSFTQRVIDNFGIIEEYKKEVSPLEKNETVDNVQELLHAIYDFTNDDGAETKNIADFLQNISLLTDQDNTAETNNTQVSLMTIHNAKGLEFNHVLIVGLEENLFPSSFCFSDEEIEEERRLLYVAITRAKISCYLSYACQRFKNGTVLPTTPSRFLKELNKNCIDFKNHTLSTDYPINRSNYDYTPNKYVDEPKISPVKCQFSRGEKVIHDIFDRGIVLDVYSENGSDRIKVDFDKYGSKVLLLQYAKLKKDNTINND